MNTRDTPGAAANGGVTEDEFVKKAPPDSDTSIDNCHHAERRAIEEARNRDTKITSISATNNCCPTCREALRKHNPDITIVNANGQPAPNP